MSRIVRRTPGLDANSAYFDHADCAKTYFEHCHRDENFRARWTAASGSWNGKIVVDVGCGPGNVFATVGPAKWAWNLRLTIYRWLKKGFHGSIEEQSMGLQSEIHHVPGRGRPVHPVPRDARRMTR